MRVVTSMVVRHNPVADQTGRVGMISLTSCTQRHATAISAAHSSMSSREGTSVIENPLRTDSVFRVRAVGDGPVGGHEAHPAASSETGSST
ncbi:hypothetical protein ACH3Y9_08150 [Streptomyces sp. WSLK1-5]|uniref:hypothetical protein n=1 Tax=unclassified Streptomyces TaxID=2593676 RepID=UPI00378BCC73